jgi:DNA-binding MarR family transcriptional regulator
MADDGGQPDPLIHQPVRLKIMSALKSLNEREMLEFVKLKQLSGATEGNLGAHITSLESAGYIEVAKDFHNNRPRTRAKLTRAGRRAFEDYVAYLRSIIGEG